MKFFGNFFFNFPQNCEIFGKFEKILRLIRFWHNNITAGYFFTPKFLLFLHQNFCFFYTKIFAFFTPKFLLFLHQKFLLFYTKILFFYTKIVAFFIPKILFFLHQNFYTNFWNLEKYFLEKHWCKKNKKWCKKGTSYYSGGPFIRTRPKNIFPPFCTLLKKLN